MLWQVSFGFWVTWSISSWQEYYKSFFLPKSSDQGQNFFSVSQQLMLKFSAKWILSILSDSSLTRNTEINVYFFFWMMKLTKTPNCQVPNSCFSITINFIVQKLKFCKTEKEDTLITLLSAWDRSRDSTAKISLSKHMWWAYTVFWVV